ncbi:MFS general substrate transporter [Guyanagaster necrorhizus]|uniref:MFS general substrate transporter n=1 Tax=Guyanagaster necrorhizus TaxID=856835 RepID=A0A9P7W4R4_9AGAR|nr:MFS general substrate transporter [Guyanagaster necrorhizus MCA 3950]KAG7451286.1 MFS general substrate transporter [Guyanagaster necrorhizus MCA 3950]
MAASKEEIAASPAINAHEIPDGGLRAWMTVIGAFLVVFVFFRLRQLLRYYYVREFLSDHSSSRINWIGSVQILGLGSLGIYSGFAMDREHFRSVMLASSTLLVFSLFMTSLTEEQKFWQIFLAQGIGIGIAVGIVYVPVLGVVSHHFKRCRSLVIGIVESGSPLAVSSTRAFFNLGLLILANVPMTTRLPPRLGGTSFAEQLAYWKRFFTGKAYLVAIAGNFILFLGVYFPTFYLQLNATEHGVNENLAFHTIAVLNGAGAFGRVMPTIVVDRIGVFNSIVPCAIACGVLVFVWVAITSPASVMVFAVLYGFFSGAVISLLGPMITYLTKNVSEVGARLGVYIGIAAVGGMIGPPISGALITSTYNGQTVATACDIQWNMLRRQRFDSRARSSPSTTE